MRSPAGPLREAGPRAIMIAAERRRRGLAGPERPIDARHHGALLVHGQGDDRRRADLDAD
jgi:hypothetical protein